MLGANQRLLYLCLREIYERAAVKLAFDFNQCIAWNNALEHLDFLARIDLEMERARVLQESARVSLETRVIKPQQVRIICRIGLA